MKIIITNDDTPEDIERKMAKAFAPLMAMLEAWERVFGPSSNGRKPDSESVNEGSTPSRPAISASDRTHAKMYSKRHNKNYRKDFIHGECDHKNGIRKCYY